MRHFIAYHNTERMGRSLCDGNPLGLQTNKPVERLLDNTIWFVQGDGVQNKQYSLGSVFVVNETGETGGGEFKWFARGRGHAFDPPIPLNALEWFPRFFKLLAHFSLGVRELSDESLIAALRQVSSLAGYSPPE
jgi:hypothetical protein